MAGQASVKSHTMRLHTHTETQTHTHSHICAHVGVCACVCGLEWQRPFKSLRNWFSIFKRLTLFRGPNFCRHLCVGVKALRARSPVRPLATPPAATLAVCCCSRCVRVCRSDVLYMIPPRVAFFSPQLGFASSSLLRSGSPRRALEPANNSSKTIICDTQTKLKPKCNW